MSIGGMLHSRVSFCEKAQTTKGFAILQGVQIHILLHRATLWATHQNEITLRRRVIIFGKHHLCRSNIQHASYTVCLAPHQREGITFQNVPNFQPLEGRPCGTELMSDMSILCFVSLPGRTNNVNI
jgi:hypothetical protein